MVKSKLETFKIDKSEEKKWPPNVKIWIDRVEYDMETANAMYKTGRYLYVVFMCQQAVEKAFKAVLSLQRRPIIPIHNISKLAKKADMLEELTEEQRILLDNLSTYYLNSRYKETIQELSRAIGNETSKEYLEKSKDFIQWLIQRMKQLL